MENFNEEVIQNLIKASTYFFTYYENINLTKACKNIFYIILKLKTSSRATNCVWYRQLSCLSVAHRKTLYQRTIARQMLFSNTHFVNSKKLSMQNRASKH